MLGRIKVSSVALQYFGYNGQQEVGLTQPDCSLSWCAGLSTSCAWLTENAVGPHILVRTSLALSHPSPAETVNWMHALECQEDPVNIQDTFYLPY